MRGALLITATLLSLAFWPGHGSEAQERVELAKVTPHAGGVRFEPGFSERPWVLRVSGPDGFFLQQEVASADDFVLALAGSNDGAAPEGWYTWEVRVDDWHRSGRFQTSNGAVLLPDPARVDGGPERAGTPSSLEPEPTGGVVIHPDDVYVQGQMCIGTDCQGTEPLPLEVVRLKQNNPWIHFEDTSASPGFATNDWRIHVNDNFGGGADYFAIEDLTGGATPFTIEAGADGDALYVDDQGRVGLGTAAPSERLEVMGNAVITGDLSVLSSRSAKERFESIDGGELLAGLAELPLAEWSYRTDPSVRHIGPTAEDFRAAFPLGRDERHVSPSDLAGVALAAAQELNRRLNLEVSAVARELENRDRQLEALRSDRVDLLRRLEALERRLDEKTASAPGG